MFSKKQIDELIVQYLHSTDIDGIPAVITNHHDGFASYATLRDGLCSSTLVCA